MPIVKPAFNRPRPKGRKTRGFAGRAIDQVRARHQPQTALMFGLTIPPSLLTVADEVIE